jgi:hypothetical protein
MNVHPSMKKGRPDRLVSLVLLIALLAACGGPSPTAVVLVATHTPTSTPEHAATWTPEPGPPRPELQFVGYEHPSGAFRLDLPQGVPLETGEDTVSFRQDDSLLLVRFIVPTEPLSGDELQAIMPPLVEAALMEKGIILSYSDLEVEGNQAGDAAVGRMAVVLDQSGSGEAEILLWQVEHVLYIMILVTPDYAAAREYWTRAMDSLVPSVEGVPLPAASEATQPVEPTAAPQTSPTSPPVAQPTSTPRPQPTSTPRPQPTATRRPQPTATPPPSLPAGQGCYLFENSINAEVTVTFTAQDRQWSDSFKVPANGTKEYCLDPGRYTYTIDAPPPWGSTNGELVVNAGDRYRWPIRGG